jgi:hypothetical protein
MPISKASSSAVAPGAKGQLVVGNATNDSGILSVGANGTVLTADSAEATGVKWATAAAGGMTLLSTTTLSGASTTISGISQDYTNLMVLIWGMTNDTANGSFCFEPQASDNTVLTYRLPGVAFRTNGAIAMRTMTETSTGLQNILRTDNGNGFVFTITNYSDTSGFNKAISAQGAALVVQSGTEFYSYGNAGGMDTQQPISKIRIYNSGGNWSGGTVKIWGIK